MRYKIEKGNHFANFTLDRLFPFSGFKRSGKVKFSKECLIKGEIEGWNKLTGISSKEIHTNSGRLVWRSDGEKILIAGYVYERGERKETLITSVLTDVWYNYNVEYKNHYWKLSIAGKEVIMYGHLKGLKFKAYPYFGGQSTAPETMYIWLS